jgi:hypothetical protein
MRTRVTFLTGFAAGYVLGSRAGRERYEQIRRAASAFAGSPAVQSAASSLQHQAGDALVTAKDKAADALGDRRPNWLPHGSTETGGAGVNGATTGGNGRSGR